MCIYFRSTIAWILLVGAAASAADIAGSSDHPLITRYPGSEISWYEVQEFEPYRMAIGPVTGYRKIDDWREVEGKITRINYALTGDRAFYEVYVNYLDAVKKAGFEVLADGFDKNSGVGKDVGGRGFMQVAYQANPFPPGTSRLLDGSATSGGSGFFAARLERAEGNVNVAVGAAQYSQNEIVVLVDIIEERAMEGDLVFVDAKAMSDDIDKYGKVALYGIFFDHDKASIQEASLPALQEIAKLLTNRPDLNVYVVGHTDLSGGLDYNITLSKERAASVVAALTKDHGIAADRLIPQGVGPLVPVASNSGDPGKAKNRRVELVER
ncbi:MAG: OmpA family protein [Candidatus Hydrogenedentes bacterium]|nr:OmpA family protein [Candidatus Hydrogenedentota bacterium]